MNSDGTGKIKIPHPSGIGNITRRDPALSPDGTRIAFASNGTAATDLKQLDIYVSKVDGSGFVRLTQMQRCEQPAWSPNGFKLRSQDKVSVRNLPMVRM
jgi:Tol biopolymer transport system component